MKGYKAFADAMKSFGVTHVFYLEAIIRYGMRECNKMGIKTICAHTENAAAYMAEGYSRSAKRPGVCMAQSIGSYNLSGGVHEAWLACSPVVAITGKKDPMHQYRGSYQEADHRNLYESITKFNGEIADSKQFNQVINSCFRAASTGKPRPSHIDVLDNTGSIFEHSDVDDNCVFETMYGQVPAYRPIADQASIDRAVKLIEAAERPVIVAGRGVIISEAKEELVALARKNDIPVVITPDGKTTIDEDDELFVGVVGDYGDICANKVVMNADLVIYVGSQANDQATIEWTVPPIDTQIVQLDIDPAELGKNYPKTAGIFADAKIGLQQLIDAIAEQKRGEWRAQVDELVAITRAKKQELANTKWDTIHAAALCREVSKALPDDAILVADTGYSAIWSATMIPMKQSQSYYRAAGNLGYAYPASIGVKCGAPDRPVVCFCGDGSFYYHMNEMETAARHGINTVTVLNNNYRYGQCVPVEMEIFPNEPAKALEKCCFKNDVNFTAIAEQYGLYTERVTKEEDIGPAIQRALAASRPALVEVITDPESHPLPALETIKREA